ncbi:putative Potassium voltage-gated channel subfamily H member 7 [Hypsibius exemplaris]|uniref:Potassium voltage-gated channel subfamily H member 7 n=1 Tax=Hypsibius exemplaris TaxID=2072580 RepID=A0A9X6RNY3_HYPEX|nr:putative Potassium voltage-gated channel subfamily H member 7 [Hypsibius exemplaris]
MPPPMKDSKISESIIRKFESQNRIFLVCNTIRPLPRIIYASEKFQEFSGFTRAEVMRHNCRVALLHGPRTDQHKINEIEAGVQSGQELQVSASLYKKDGSEIMCNVILIPVRNELAQIIMFILNFENLNPDGVAATPNGQMKKNPLDSPRHMSR